MIGPPCRRNCDRRHMSSVMTYIQTMMTNSIKLGPASALITCFKTLSGICISTPTDVVLSNIGATSDIASNMPLSILKVNAGARIVLTFDKRAVII